MSLTSIVIMLLACLSSYLCIFVCCARFLTYLTWFCSISFFIPAVAESSPALWCECADLLRNPWIWLVNPLAHFCRHHVVSHIMLLACLFLLPVRLCVLCALPHISYLILQYYNIEFSVADTSLLEFDCADLSILRFPHLQVVNCVILLACLSSCLCISVCRVRFLTYLTWFCSIITLFCQWLIACHWISISLFCHTVLEYDLLFHLRHLTSISALVLSENFGAWSLITVLDDEVFTVPHRFQPEPVGTRRIPTGIFWVGYLPNKQGTSFKISTWIPVGSEFPGGSTGTKSNQIPPGSNWKNSHFSKFTNNSKRFILSYPREPNQMFC